VKLSLAIAAFLLDKRIAGCSPNTLRNYTLHLQRLRDHLEADPDLAAITVEQLKSFLNALMTARIAPRGVAARPARRLSAKTIQNVHTCLCSLWTWALKEGHAQQHLPRAIDVAAPERPVVEPFTKEQIQELLGATTHSATWERLPETATELPRERQFRDKAIILFLLDTGVRAGELCQLDVGDLDLSAGHAMVRSKGRLNSGEGKARPICFSPTTIRALHRYLAERKALGDRNAARPLFATRVGRRFDRRYLAKHLRRLGRRAGVKDVHTHRFRHTFAINYLRNGGDVYTLQDLLGHTSLDMVRRYLHLAQVDVDSAHRRASPVENWRL